MGTTFREQDKGNLQRMTKATRDDVFGAQPELSVEQVAGLLTSGADDAHRVSVNVLYKIIEGVLRLPLHKVGRLGEVTGGSATINEICTQAGGLFLRIPKITDIEMQSLCPAISEFADLMKETAHALTTVDSKGRRVDPEEAALIRQEGLEAIVEIITLISHCDEQAELPAMDVNATLAASVEHKRQEM